MSRNGAGSSSASSIASSSSSNRLARMASIPEELARQSDPAPPAEQKPPARRYHPVRTSRAFSQLEEPGSLRDLEKFLTKASAKTVDVRRMVSPTRPGKQDAASSSSSLGFRSPPPAPPGSPSSDFAITTPSPDFLLRKKTRSVDGSDDGSNSTRSSGERFSPPKRASSRLTDMPATTEEWLETAKRLSQRVQELEMENLRLKSGRRDLQLPPPKTFAGDLSSLLAESEATAVSSEATSGSASSRKRGKLSKSQSYASGFGFTGLTVAEAAAASHRSRSKRQAQQTRSKYRSGYWNGSKNVTSSFSCNNLSDLDQPEMVFERFRVAAGPKPMLAQSSAPNSPGADGGGFEPAVMKKPLMGQSGSFERSNSEASFSFLPQQQFQPADMAKTFGLPVMPRQTSSLHTDMDDGDVEFRDEMTQDSMRVTSPRSYLEAGVRSGGLYSNIKGTKTPARPPSSRDVRVWVGTWNMGAADPFIDGGGIIDEQRSAGMLNNFVPHGYQLYVLGVQEGVSENVYHAVEAYLNRNEAGTRYYRMELKNSNSMVTNKYHNADAVIDAVHGRGDGAFMGTKFTGMAVFYCSDVKEKVKLVRSGVHKFNLTSGSKGGVAVALMIHNTTMVFVNCHLDARNDAYRREQIRNLNSNLGRIMGHNSFDLTEQFHHVIWMGDMNYRIVLLDPQMVLHMLEEGRNLELHDKFDGLLNDRRNGGVFEGFTEPNKFPDFYPTYKKFPKRGIVSETMPLWPSLVFRVLYKEPFYKGGKVKKRVPGWCDRILIHSLLVSDSKLIPEKVLNPFAEERSWIDNYRSINHGDGMDVSDHSPVCGTFILSFPHGNRDRQANSTLSPRSNNGSSSRSRSISSRLDSETAHFSRSVNGSYFDHPRVVRHLTKSERPVSTVLRVFNMQLQWNGNAVVPKRTRVIAPLMGEDDNKQVNRIGERILGVKGYDLSLNVVLQHSRPLELLHMLVWVKNESIQGHCTLSLKRIARQEEGGEVVFRVPLYNDSMRLYHEGHPLLVVFSVRSKMFAK